MYFIYRESASPETLRFSVGRELESSLIVVLLREDCWLVGEVEPMDYVWPDVRMLFSCMPGLCDVGEPLSLSAATFTETSGF